MVGGPPPLPARGRQGRPRCACRAAADGCYRRGPMRPALIVLADDPATGIDGLTDDPRSAESLFAATLELARQVGGVGRVLLFHPPEAEGSLVPKSLGFRLWPQEGATPGERYANAFKQAGDLGYEGAVVIGLGVPDLPAEVVTEAAAMLEEHQGVVVPDTQGGIALLALQRPEPTLFAAGPLPTIEDLRLRAKQQLVRLVEQPAHAGLTADTLAAFLAQTG